LIHAKRAKFKKGSKKLEKLKYLNIMMKLKRQMSKTRNKLGYAIKYLKRLYERSQGYLDFRISESEAIYIPESYWHKVDSISKECVSVNFWYRDMVSGRCEGKEQYLVRHCL
jgi:hypothetical protein